MWVLRTELRCRAWQQASFPALEADLRCAQSHLDEMKIFVADMAVCVCRWVPDKE